MIAAAYFDGLSSRRHAVTLRADSGVLRISGDAVERSVPWSAVRVSERLGRVPRKLEFGDGSFCEVDDHAALQPLLDAAGVRGSFVERLQLSWPAALTALAATATFFLAAYLWGLPWLADNVARRMPERVVRMLSTQTLEFLDRAWLEESKLPPARRNALAAGFAGLQPPGARVEYRLIFRSSPAVGPNAFALPDGSIVLLDELVVLADHDQQVLAVLGHELGHVHHRHGLRLLVQNTVVGAATALWFGDTSSLLAAVPAALAQAHYSRALEAEADRYGTAMLRANGIKTARLAEILEKLVEHEQHMAQSDAGGSWTDYLSTHPAPASRIDALRAPP